MNNLNRKLCWIFAIAIVFVIRISETVGQQVRPRDEDDDDDDDDFLKLGKGAVVGIVIGAISLLIAVPIILCFCCGCFCFDPDKKQKIIGVSRSASLAAQVNNRNMRPAQELQMPSIRKESDFDEKSVRESFSEGPNNGGTAPAYSAYPMERGEEDNNGFYYLGFQPPPPYPFSPDEDLQSTEINIDEEVSKSQQAGPSKTKY